MALFTYGWSALLLIAVVLAALTVWVMLLRDHSDGEVQFRIPRVVEFVLRIGVKPKDDDAPPPAI